MQLQVSKKGNRVGKETQHGKVSFDMRNHNFYLSGKKIAKYIEGSSIQIKFVDESLSDEKRKDLMRISRELFNKIATE